MNETQERSEQRRYVSQLPAQEDTVIDPQTRTAEAEDETTFVQYTTSTVALPLIPSPFAPYHIIPSDANNPETPDSDMKTVFTTFEHWNAEEGKYRSGRVFNFAINKSCTHCAVVYSFETALTFMLQLWNTVSGKLQWSGTIHKDVYYDIPPAFSPDGGHVGFVDRMGVTLIAILPERAAELERVSYSHIAERFALATDARRMAFFRGPYYGDNVRQLTSISLGQRTLDTVAIKEGSVVAGYYSETETILYSLSVDHDKSVHKIQKFHLGSTSHTTFESRGPLYCIATLRHPSIRFHAHLNDLNIDGSINSSTFGVVFECFVKLEGYRYLGFLRRKKFDKRVVVNIRSDMITRDELYLSPCEAVVWSDGRIFVVDFEQGHIFEWNTELYNLYVVATFPPVAFARGPVVSFRDGRLVWLDIRTGEFAIIETQKVMDAKT